jgi:Ni/Co efflux regulator RcnB
MRKLLISLLLAGAAATPAIAEPGDHHHDSNNARAERQQARSERQSSSTEHQVNGQAHLNGNGGQGGQPNIVRSNGFQQGGQVDPAQAQAFRAERQRMMAAQNGSDDSQRDRRNFRRNWQNSNGGVQPQVGDEALRQHDRPLPRVLRTRDRSQMVSDVPRRGTQPPMRWDNNHRRDRVNWSMNWRNDRRYDWRDWRHHHRSTFHLGFYFDPFGWGYQPFDIGWRLWPNYYSSNYWINDPWQYRLPYAPPGTRWIRYYNDALLVDMYTGEVVDAIRDFFW